ncbi:hypothetical protein GCM10007079_14220 [Nocardiopsis terrae]|uniref:Uncharacterized protein n=1 Tax=Nocardiopsis terrae TaxID=372655 RepID=A0ABR9HC52_9ACTN|nr:hypothetical protein [Nocardiopsis terrae]MBE1456375.1 hypothetical protein [Nocardiopsis terrae]GHC77214.1 hypothetical protein GCM10007079_14220 [Nocardiopsis terrae]
MDVFGQRQTQTTRTTQSQNTGPRAEVLQAFREMRGLTFTVEWRRFPWTRGADLERALVGPAYLGNVALGLKDRSHWAYQSRDGRTWRYIPRAQVRRLVHEVVEEFAGFVPPLPRRP